MRQVSLSDCPGNAPRETIGHRDIAVHKDDRGVRKTKTGKKRKCNMRTNTLCRAKATIGNAPISNARAGRAAANKLGDA